MSKVLDELLALLALEKIEEGLFRGQSQDLGLRSVFGGQVMGQALSAAKQTVALDRQVHSCHSYFLRPGDANKPIVYDVENIRDGGSFATRRVIAIQHGKPIYFMTASFQDDEDGLEHQTPMPDVPQPEDLLGEADLKQRFMTEAPEHIRAYWQRPRPIELRPVSLDHYFSREKLEPRQNIWVRTTGPVPAERHLQAAVLAYLSDMTLLDTSLFAHGTSVLDRSLQVASLDHAMWFHRPPNVDDWLLYSQDSPSASGGRGMTRGAIFTRSGTLIASVAQEGLIRKKATD